MREFIVKHRVALILLAVVLQLSASRLRLPWLPFLGADADDKLLLTSTSPNGAVTLTAYRIMEGATVADSIRVYRDFGPVTGCIYNAYREQEVTIVWLSDTVAEINGVALDLSEGETYDWRR